MCSINFALMLSSKDVVSYWFIYVNMMNRPIIKSKPYNCELDNCALPFDRCKRYYVLYCHVFILL